MDDYQETHTNDLRSAYDQYVSDALKEIGGETCFGQHVYPKMMNPDGPSDSLEVIANIAEELSSFQRLVALTQKELCGDLAKGITSFVQLGVSRYFKRSRFYLKAYHGEGVEEYTYDVYLSELTKKHYTTTYLAPIEYVYFGAAKLIFPGYEIRLFDVNELNRLLGNDINRVFFPWAYCDCTPLQKC